MFADAGRDMRRYSLGSTPTKPNRLTVSSNQIRVLMYSASLRPPQSPQPVPGEVCLLVPLDVGIFQYPWNFSAVCHHGMLKNTILYSGRDPKSETLNVLQRIVACGALSPLL
ncbi:hypothetical protein J6590_066388 [Homalodisca vitripennis]|nr:hypothetical protein J6590_066388 [Homalodisca vitripennis]